MVEGTHTLQQASDWAGIQLLRPLVRSQLSTVWLVWDGHQYGCLKRVQRARDYPQLCQEYRLLSQLQRPWVKAIGLLEHQGEPGLLLEQLDGGMLSYAQLSAQPEHWQQLLNGIAQLHQLGWLHGDIKPENIWLTESGVLRLFDLGAAQPLDGCYPATLQFTPGLTDVAVAPGVPVCPQHDLSTLLRLLKLLSTGHSDSCFPQLARAMGWRRAVQLVWRSRQAKLTFPQLATLIR